MAEEETPPIEEELDPADTPAIATEKPFVEAIKDDETYTNAQKNDQILAATHAGEEEWIEIDPEEVKAPTISEATGHKLPYKLGPLFELPESTDDIFKKGIEEQKLISPEQADKEIIEEHNASYKTAAQNEEIAKMEAEEPKSLWWLYWDTVKQAGLGVLKGVEETGETLGLLEDNAWNIPEPKDTRQALTQGFAQAFSFFIPAQWATKAGVKAIPIGAKLTALFGTSKKLKRAQDILAFGTAGALTDAVPFDSTDPNAGNLLLFLDSISKSPVASNLLYTYLASKPEGHKSPITGELDPDTEFVARGKNILTGGIAGILVAFTVRNILDAFGFAYSKVSTAVTSEVSDVDISKSLKAETEQINKAFEAETGVSIKELEGAVEEYVEEITPILKEVYDSSDAGTQKAILDGLPKNLDGATKAEIERSVKSPVIKVAQHSTEPNPEVIKFLTKVANNEKIDPTDYFYIDKKTGKKKPIIESFNLLKAKTVPEIKSQIQALSRIIDSKSLKNKDYLSQIEEVATLLGRPTAEVIESLSKNVANLEQAVGYVPAYKAMVLMSLDNAHALFKKFKNVKPGSDDYDSLLRKRNAAAAHLEIITNLASRESNLASHLLNAHRSLADPDMLLKKSQVKVASELLDAAPEAEIKYAATVDNIINISKKRTEEFQEAVDVDVKIGDAPTRTVKVKPSETKKGKQIKAKIASTSAIIARLEKKLQNLKEGKPQSKKKEKRIPTARELELKDQIKVEQEKLKLPAEQRALRLRHERLSKKLRELKKGTVSSAGFKELKTTEISELKAAISKLKKRIKPVKTNAEKAEANIKRLKAELDSLILTKKGTDKPVKTPRDKTALEKELIEEIANQKKRLGILKKDKTVTLEDLRDLAIKTSSKEELDIINKSTLRQLRMRALATRLTRWQKYRHISEEVFINGLLSSFKTPVVNGIGNNFALGITPIDKFMAAYKGGGAVTYKEGTIFAYKALTSIPTQFKAFMRAMRYGTDDIHIKTDIQKPQTRYLSKELLGYGGWKGTAIDWLGTVLNLPGKTVTSMDVAYKGLNYAGEVPALAYRKAVSEYMEKHKGLAPETADELAGVELRSKEIIDDIDLHPEIQKAAKELSEQNTFTNPLADVEELVVTPEGVKTRRVAGFSKNFQKALERDETGMAKAFLPFYHTPYQLINYSFKRSPLTNWAHRELKRELDPKLSSPETVQMAKGRVATGQMLLGGSFALAMNGNITNGPPADYKLRMRMEKAMGGPHWWTFNIGFGPVPYSRWDPVGIIFAQAAILNNFRTAITHLNAQSTLDREGNPIAEDRKLVEKYNELWAMGVTNLQSLIKDRHYLQSVMTALSIFDEDSHTKKQWMTQFRSRYDPTLSLFSSLRRNVVKGYEAARPLKDLPRREASILDEEGNPTGEIEGTAFEKSVKEQIKETLTHFDNYNKTISGYDEKAAPTRNLMGETEFYPGTHYENVNHIRPKEYVRNMVNSVLNIGATNIGLSESQSAVIRKLAELESKIEAPSQIKSFSIGKHHQTKKSLGTVMLNTEEQRFFMNKWIELNTKNNNLERLVRRKEWRLPPKNLDHEQLAKWWSDHLAKGGKTASEQKFHLEMILRKHKDIAILETKSEFKDLMARMNYLKKKGMEATDAPVSPTLGLMNQFNEQLAPLQPLEQGQQ